MRRAVLLPSTSLHTASHSMRLDLFLKRSRVIPRRALAHEICEGGFISVNGRVAKGSRLVKVGDLIQWRQPHAVRSLKVCRIPSLKQGKVSGLYELVSTDFPPIQTREVLVETNSS